MAKFAFFWACVFNNLKIFLLSFSSPVSSCQQPQKCNGFFGQLQLQFHFCNWFFNAVPIKDGGGLTISKTSEATTHRTQPKFRERGNVRWQNIWGARPNVSQSFNLKIRRSTKPYPIQYSQTTILGNAATTDFLSSFSKFISFSF